MSPWTPFSKLGKKDKNTRSKPDKMSLGWQ